MSGIARPVTSCRLHESRCDVAGSGAGDCQTGTVTARRPGRGSRGSWPRLRGKLPTSEAPTEPLLLVHRLEGTPYRDPVQMASPQRREARRVLEFSLDLAELLLRYGAGTAEVETSVIAAGVALGMPATELDLDITYSSVLVAYAPSGDEPMTALRVMRRPSLDHSKLVAVHGLVADLVAGRLDRQDAFARLAEIRHARRPWSRWLVTLAWGGLAAAAAVRFGGTPASAVAAFGASCAVDRIGRELAVRRVPGFFLSGVGAVLATGIAIGLHALDAPVQPNIVVAGGLVVLLPGLGLVAAMQDGIRGFPVTAVGRLFAVTLATVAIVSGVALALRLGDAAGHPVVINKAGTAGPLTDLAVGTAATAAGAFCAAVAYRLPGRLLLPTAVVGALGYLVLFAAQAVVANTALATAVGCVAVGLVGRIVALRRLAPPIALVVPAVTPLLPGLALFEAMRALTQASSTSVSVTTGIVGLLGAATVALGIGAGVVLGDQLAAPIERGLGNARRRLPGRRADQRRPQPARASRHP